MVSSLKGNIILYKGDIILGEKIKTADIDKRQKYLSVAIKTELEIVVIESKCLLDEKS